MVDRRLAVSVAALVAATAFAGWAAWSWSEVSASDPAATARDEALQDGRLGVATLNTMDHRSAESGLRRWLDASTGELHDELSRGLQDSRTQIEQAKTVTEGRVVDAAVTELDAAKGTARVIAAVEIVVTPDGGQPAIKRSRMQAALTRTETGWKLSAIGQVPTGLP